MTSNTDFQPSHAGADTCIHTGTHTHTRTKKLIIKSEYRNFLIKNIR